MTPVEMLNNFGLERSLTATYNDNRYVLQLPGTMAAISNSIMNSNRSNKQNGYDEKVDRYVCYQTFT